MDQDYKNAITTLAETFATAYHIVFDMVGDPNVAVAGGNIVLTAVLQNQGQNTKEQAPTVDDIIARLRKAAQEEHGEGGET
jgi:hypothetical protein